MYGTQIKLLSNKKEPMLLNYIYEQVSFEYALPTISLILNNASRHALPWPPRGKYRVAYVAPLSYDGNDEFVIRYKPGHDTVEECSIHVELNHSNEEIRSLIFDFPFMNAKGTFSQVMTVIKEVSSRRKHVPEFICYGFKEKGGEYAFISETRLSMFVMSRERRYMHRTFEVNGIEAFA